MKLTKKLTSKLIEAALFAEAKPMSVEKLRKVLPRGQRPPLGDVRKILDDLVKHYQNRGVQLVEVASGFRFQICEETAEHLVEQKEEKPMRMSKAFMETLALAAYRQPITRGEIEAIRGVAVSSGIIQTLLELDWIKEVGHKDVPGKPALFATTKKFLDFFNLKSLEDLPPLAELEELSENKMKEEFEQLNLELEHQIEEEEHQKELEKEQAEHEQAEQAQSDEQVECKGDVVEQASNEDQAEQASDEDQAEMAEVDLDEQVEAKDQGDFEIEVESVEAQDQPLPEDEPAQEVESELKQEEAELEVEQGASNHKPLEEFSEIILTGPMPQEKKSEAGGEND